MSFDNYDGFGYHPDYHHSDEISGYGAIMPGGGGPQINMAPHPAGAGFGPVDHFNYQRVVPTTRSQRIRMSGAFGDTPSLAISCANNICLIYDSITNDVKGKYDELTRTVYVFNPDTNDYDFVGNSSGQGGAAGDAEIIAMVAEAIGYLQPSPSGPPPPSSILSSKTLLYVGLGLGAVLLFAGLSEHPRGRR